MNSTRCYWTTFITSLNNGTYVSAAHTIIFRLEKTRHRSCWLSEYLYCPGRVRRTSVPSVFIYGIYLIIARNERGSPSIRIVKTGLKTAASVSKPLRIGVPRRQLNNLSAVWTGKQRVVTDVRQVAVSWKASAGLGVCQTTRCKLRYTCWKREAWTCSDSRHQPCRRVIGC